MSPGMLQMELYKYEGPRIVCSRWTLRVGRSVIMARHPWFTQHHLHPPQLPPPHPQPWPWISLQRSLTSRTSLTTAPQSWSRQPLQGERERRSTCSYPSFFLSFSGHLVPRHTCSLSYTSQGAEPRAEPASNPASNPTPGPGPGLPHSRRRTGAGRRDSRLGLG